MNGDEADGYAADEADLERGQIESILPLLGDGSVPLEQCGPFGICTTYTSRVTGETRMVSGFRIVFRRALKLKEGEEWGESDVWSSSVPEASTDEGDGGVHSGDDLSGDDAEGDLPSVDEPSDNLANTRDAGQEASVDGEESQEGVGEPSSHVNESQDRGGRETGGREGSDNYQVRTMNRL